MNKFFTRLDLRRLHNEEWFNFFTEYKGFVLYITAAVLGIQQLFANFIELMQKADAALEQIRKSKVTDDIVQLDARRDNAFRMLKSALRYGLSSTDPNQLAAAKKLEPVFKHYGNLAAKSYDDETAGIVNFIQDLRGSYASYVEILEWEGMIAALELANNEFEAAILLRNAESADRPAYKMLDLRTKINRCYLDMIEKIEAKILLNGDEDIAEFVKNLNSNIERYKQTLARRKPASRVYDEQTEEDSTI
ncbi:MAG: DUF6261 family protein [Prevotellaceae bacterium]|jgi:hypothetical protein|nr:DUF6261 family protein [Prevotellaceae bacterium]